MQLVARVAIDSQACDTLAPEFAYLLGYRAIAMYVSWFYEFCLVCTSRVIRLLCAFPAQRIVVPAAIELCRCKLQSQAMLCYAMKYTMVLPDQYLYDHSIVQQYDCPFDTLEKRVRNKCVMFCPCDNAV